MAMAFVMFVDNLRQSWVRVVLLNLSVAFDTINYGILLDWLGELGWKAAFIEMFEMQ